ncbi:hypothetical protein N7501_010188 [Penicillium viridicatum]|nr:hypothetical protein N7501_010188 [Penicillium viridicatum]
MIHEKMLSWQLASLMMAHSRKMTVTLSGSIICCGELVASRPKKLSNQLLKPPCSFASRSVLPPEIPSPILSVPIFILARIGPSLCGKSMVVVSAQQAKLPELLQAYFECYQPGKPVPQLNGGSRTLHTPAFDRRQIVKGNATFGAGQRKAHCLHCLNRTGIGRLIDLPSPAAGPIVQWQRLAGMSVFARRARSNPLYGRASAYYRDVGNEAYHLPIYHLAASSDGLVARHPSEYGLDLHSVTVDQKYTLAKSRAPIAGSILRAVLVTTPSNATCMLALIAE